MLSYRFLFDIAIILLSTKVFGLISQKLKMPQVVGALFAGVILGPAVLNILHETEFIHQMAELGVIVLMFTAGLEADVNELKKTGKAATVIAILGVLVPLLGGFLVSYIFSEGRGAVDTNALLQDIFVGVILTATSVSITVQTLKELGSLNSRAGNTILGAALIDDILGIIILTIITSLADTSVNIYLVFIKIVLFFVFAILFAIVFKKVFKIWADKYNGDVRRFAITSFVICLLLSFIAEEVFGVADITGAFIAGLIISNNKKSEYIDSRFETLSYMLLSPIFFASIGIRVEITGMNLDTIIFTVILLIIAILTKIIGCALGAKLCKYSIHESVQIGAGMVSRGEVALIVANKGIAVSLINTSFLTPIVIVVVITTVITPILLEIAFSREKKIDELLD
ncbi:sodium:proton antiporter [Clostridium baratii]|uniref:Sodium/hydrogen exchanger n=1 Tax=Clostridium baratii TaxID=1561 RepID=A0A174TCI5_9CLOT|nr:cation:proton antiporter [Clostridium baratii]OPF52668.1 sodium:proton antiporter [Clostridium baratii]OPF56117.1 sodium:proton antiporter [Clostridium baratii]OPF58288.1 sodium:proton antiporter [Clostridium baratii]OPF59501.1 sodium:proton antiporter [Clostridium baratii]CUQ05648.1 sodium/hydrogen exchanger [Clostridium baratii]